MKSIIFAPGDACWMIQKPMLRSDSGKTTQSRKTDTAIIVAGRVVSIGESQVYAEGAEIIVDFAVCYPVCTGEDCFNAGAYELGTNFNQTLFRPGVNCFKTKGEAEAAAAILCKIGYRDRSQPYDACVTDASHHRITPNRILALIEAA